MDVTPHLELVPAPKVVWERAKTTPDAPRFMVRPPSARASKDTADFVAVTWREYAQGMRDVALWLQTVMSPGDRACIFAPNQVAWLQAAMGIEAMGGAMVPIYGSSTADQAAHVVAHSGAKVVFVDTSALLERVLMDFGRYEGVARLVTFSELDLDAAIASARAKGAPDLDRAKERITSLDAIRVEGASRATPGAFEEALDAIDLDRMALMLYTSGTSGLPKGVPLTHRNVGSNGRDWFECMAPQLEEELTDVFWLPMSHIFGLGEAGIGDRLGWVSWLVDPHETLDFVATVKPQVFMSVPSVWEKIAIATAAAPDPKERFAELTGGRFHFCLSGGAGLKREVKELFLEHDTLIIEGYGLTECSPTLTLNRPGDYRFDSVGKPFPSVELKLAEDGEILAKGPNVFAGYHDDDEATQGAFDADGWFLTGDIGRFTEDGFLQIVDRKKDILVTAGGKNVAPANIEMRFRDDPYIEHLVVYGDGKKYLVAGVWLTEGARSELGPEASDEARQALVQSRIDAVNETLARYESLKYFAILDEPLTIESGLLTPTLKVRRKKVVERYGETLEALYR